MFTLLAGELLRKGDKARALKVLQKCKEVLPAENIPYEDEQELVKMWIAAGSTADADRVALSIGKHAMQYLQWAGSIGEKKMRQKGSRFIIDCMRKLKQFNELVELPLSSQTLQTLASYQKAAYNSAAARFAMPSLVAQAKEIGDQALSISNALMRGQVGEEQMEQYVSQFYQLFLQLTETIEELQWADENTRKSLTELKQQVLGCWLSQQLNLSQEVEDPHEFPGDEELEETVPTDTL